MKKLYIAESLIDGQLVVDQLIDSGIPAELFHQNAQGGLGDLPVTYPEVWIKRDLDLDKANRVIQEYVSRPQPVHTLLCQKCGELSPGSFEICWQCFTPFRASDR